MGSIAGIFQQYKCRQCNCKSKKTTAISIAHTAIALPSSAVLNKKSGYSSPDSTTISPIRTAQLLTINNLSTNDQSPNDQSSIFHPEGLIPSSDPIDSAQYYVAKAQAVIQEVREFRKFVGYLDGESLLSLPVGIHKEIGGLDYDIAIASIKLKPQYAELEVYMTFEMPQNGKVLTFRGKGIKFTKEGGIVGDATFGVSR